VTDNYRAEVDRYRRVMERDPGSLRFAEFADRLRRDGKISDATAICARGLAYNPNYATGHVVMGEIFRDAGLLEKARQEWGEALLVDRTHPRAHLRLGELHLSRGEVRQAVAAFETALLYNPDFPEAQARLGEAREGADRGRGDHEEAGAAASRRPGERPVWLTSDRFEELVAAVSRCRSVEAAALVNSDGLLLDGNLPAPGRAEGGAGAAAELVTAARDLMKRLAAGRLRAALVRGDGGSLRCVALGDLTLAATLKPGVPVGAAGEEMEEAVLSLSGPGRSGKGARG